MSYPRKRTWGILNKIVITSPSKVDKKQSENLFESWITWMSLFRSTLRKFLKLTAVPNDETLKMTRYSVICSLAYYRFILVPRTLQVFSNQRLPSQVLINIDSRSFAIHYGLSKFSLLLMATIYNSSSMLKYTFPFVH